MTSTTRNASSITAKVIVWGFVLAAAALSFHDIVVLFERIGAPRPLSFLAPVFIDGVTWLGKLMRSHSLSQSTNRLGMFYLVLGGSASLAANLTAGQTLGMKLLGLLAVTGFILGEIALEKIEAKKTAAPAAVVKVTQVTEAEKAARKRAGYAKLDKAAKAEWTRRYRSRKTATAPTSPGYGPVSAPSTDEVEYAVR